MLEIFRRWMPWVNKFPNKNKTFCLIANGRTGSTYLMTTLSQGQNVRVAPEIKCRPEYDLNKKVHVLYAPRKNSLCNIIQHNCEPNHDAVTDDAVLCGRFILDPYVYHQPKIYDELFANIGGLDLTLFIHRDFFEQFVSWNVKSLTFTLNKDVNIELTSSYVRELTKTPPFHEETTSKEVHICRSDAHASLCDRYVDDPATIVMPYTVALDKIFMLCNNEVQILAHMQEKENFLQFDYAEINSAIVSVVSILGIKFDNQSIDDIIEKPVVIKQKDYREHVRDNLGVLQAVSRILNREIHRIISGEIDVETFWQWHDGGVIRICAQNIAHEIRQACESDEQYVRFVDTDTIEWSCIAPVR